MPRLAVTGRRIATVCAIALALAGCGNDTAQTSVDAIGPAVSQPESTLGVQPPVTTDPNPGRTDPTPAADIAIDAIERPPLSVPTPAVANVPEAPAVEDVGAKLEQNNNVRDGELGSLCWARWEVARNLLVVIVQPTRAELAVRRLEEQLGAIGATVDSVGGRLSPAVLPFAHRLKVDVGAAQTALVQSRGKSPDLRLVDVGAKFDFEAYPGAREYMTQASGHPACLTP